MAAKKAKNKEVKSSKFRKVTIVLIIMAAIGLLITFWDLFKKIYYPNVNLKDKKEVYLKIPTGSNYDNVLKILLDQNILANYTSFQWMAKSLNYSEHVHPGRYLVKQGMNNKDLVLLLRSGRQTPVKLIFNNIRTKDQFVSRISNELEADSVSLSEALNNPEFLSTYNLTTENVMSMFIPNTYEFYWNTSADQFLEKMHKEYQKFWNTANLKKATDIHLTPVEVSVLASIVEQETNRNDERPLVAGVYMNRLNKGLRLEADPTLVFAVGDFTIRRVLNVYKELDSPYNTYKYAGLPPGPICLPSLASIKAVLNYKAHDYLYFCAKADFSGYHIFAKSYPEHLLNARKYQKELTKRNIKI